MIVTKTNNCQNQNSKIILQINLKYCNQNKNKNTLLIIVTDIVMKIIIIKKSSKV